MKKVRTIIGIVSILAAFTLISGCVQDQIDDGNGEDVNGAEKYGILHLKITDKPGDLDILHANVTISMVQVHKSGAGNETDDEMDEDEFENEDENDDGFIADADGPYEGEVDEDIQFIGIASGGEEPYNWSWEFGDNNISYLQNPEHNYSTEGVYEVNLTVTDNTSLIDWYITTAKIGDVDDDNSDAGWYTIVEKSQIFDLIKLQNVTEVLGEDNLSVGKYTQIRLTVEKAEITINNSGEIEVHDLKIPSGKVKLIKPFWIYEDEKTILTLDFDVYKSVHETGNGKFIMKPTIKIIEG